MNQHRATAQHHGSPGEPLVLHVIPTPRARGAQREARALADQLDSPGVRRHRVLCLFEGEPEVKVDYSLRFPGGARPATGFDPRVVRRLRAMLGELDPAVVVAHGSDPLKYLVPAMVGTRRHLVYYVIGTYAGSVDRKLQRRLWATLAGRADVVAACGVETGRECTSLLGVSPDRVAVVSNGRDPEVFRPGPKSAGADPVVVFVGALTETKRPERFIELVAALRDRGLALQAQLVGDGPMRSALTAPAAAAGVEVLGSRDDVPALLGAADVMVFPSVPAGEGMPGVLIEAGLCGVPVVATSVPGVSTIIKDGETGLVVGIDDLPAMVDATARLIGDPGLRGQMGQAARRHCVDQFSMASVAARWAAVLEPLVAPHDSSHT